MLGVILLRKWSREGDNLVTTGKESGRMFEFGVANYFEVRNKSGIVVLDGRVHGNYGEDGVFLQNVCVEPRMRITLNYVTVSVGRPWLSPATIDAMIADANLL